MLFLVNKITLICNMDKRTLALYNDKLRARILYIRKVRQFCRNCKVEIYFLEITYRRVIKRKKKYV